MIKKKFIKNTSESNTQFSLVHACTYSTWYVNHFHTDIINGIFPCKTYARINRNKLCSRSIATLQPSNCHANAAHNRYVWKICSKKRDKPRGVRLKKKSGNGN